MQMNSTHCNIVYSPNKLRGICELQEIIKTNIKAGVKVKKYSTDDNNTFVFLSNGNYYRYIQDISELDDIYKIYGMYIDSMGDKDVISVMKISAKCDYKCIVKMFDAFDTVIYLEPHEDYCRVRYFENCEKLLGSYNQCCKRIADYASYKIYSDENHFIRHQCCNICIHETDYSYKYEKELNDYGLDYIGLNEKIIDCRN